MASISGGIHGLAFHALAGAQLFHLFLYTTNKLEVNVRQTKENEYQVKLLNLDMTIPIDVQTDAGLQRVMIDKKATTVTSKSYIIIDPKMFYLKKVVME